MQKIVYYVATSLDGFIAGANDDISKFPFGGKAVEKYKTDLQRFETIIMGRRTYEFGYKYGLKPGQPAYPNMQHHIFSKSLNFENTHDRVHIENIATERVKEIKSTSKTDVYLCGGGQFAGWLLDNGLIDQLKLKLNPIILGAGTRMFGQSKTAADWSLTGTEKFDDGLQILTYKLKKQND
ncbi:MAG: dihydrofolate reductase family protein [Marinirhabdus sp.]